MNEQHIPIEIHANKLLDWLVSRRHVSKNWQANVLQIREKINNAVQDMPAHDGIVSLVTGQHINYFHCKKIVEILKETEADTKNIFGMYGSQRMKDWNDIISSYQKENLYLAEVSQILVRNVSYEVPGLRKQVSKLQQQQVECEKKIKEFTKHEQSLLKEFQTSCEQLGIVGKNIKNELIELAKDLPRVNLDCTRAIQKLQPALELYRAFNVYHKVDPEKVLVLLNFIIENGSVTTFEYMKGIKPLKVELEEEAEPQNPVENEENAISFGDDANDSIDFGGSELCEETIDWGNSNGNTEDEFEIVEHPDAGEQQDLESPEVQDSGIIIDAERIAKGEDAMSLLDNPKTRDIVINDLMELNIFLKLRCFEMNMTSDLLSVSQMQDASDVVQVQTLETVRRLEKLVGDTLELFTNRRTLYLFNVKHSPKFVEILTTSLNQKLIVVDRVRSNKRSFEKKIQNLGNEIRSLEPAIESMIKNSSELQSNIQNDISSKYNGRVVKILGGLSVN